MSPVPHRCLPHRLPCACPGVERGRLFYANRALCHPENCPPSFLCVRSRPPPRGPTYDKPQAADRQTTRNRPPNHSLTYDSPQEPARLSDAPPRSPVRRTTVRRRTRPAVPCVGLQSDDIQPPSSISFNLDSIGNKKAVDFSTAYSAYSRDDKTRTCDLTPPRRVRYQLRYIP